MKRSISLWMGLLALALLPVLAQQPTVLTGKIHGHVTNTTGMPTTSGTVSLSNDSGRTSKYTFNISPTGEYQGDVAPGTYLVIYRQPTTPADQMVDSFDGVKVVAGQDTVQDIDMSRKAFLDTLSPEQRKALEELKKMISEGSKVVNAINSDLGIVGQDFKDAINADATASQQLGATASKADVDAKATEIRTAKYTEIETLMLKDSVVKPDASILWAQLGQAQVGLKKYDDAEVSYKKVIELDAASKKPNLQAQGAANAGLGEIYALTGKIPESQASYDAAAKADPQRAAFYLTNEAVIFSHPETNNPDAQVAAADKAIQADPTAALAYYLKGQGLIGKATVDPTTQRIVLPPDCSDAYQKYLQLAPTGQFAPDVKAILEQAGQKIETSYKAEKPKRK
jgi:tetratricopeptide (TPR) repeat protein